jgi:hypothetical protein
MHDPANAWLGAFFIAFGRIMPVPVSASLNSFTTDWGTPMRLGKTNEIS